MGTDKDSSGGLSMKGYAGQILKVNLSEARMWKEKLGGDMIANFLGGLGFAVKLVYDSVEANVDALGPLNALAITPGLFTGLPIPTAGKTVFCSKSPLTGTICESVTGGSIGSEIKHAGYDAVVITGKVQKPSYLLIEDDRVRIEDATDIWGMNTRETARILRKRHNSAIVACIGIGGENLVRYACIDCEERQAGRGGLGAVMGSKMLKAIAVKGGKDIEPADPIGLMSLASDYYDRMLKSAAYEADTKYGTGEFLNWINEEKGVFPTRNWREGVFKESEEIDPYYWAPKYSKRNRACYACTKPCGQLFAMESGKFAGTVIDGVEYELLYSLGAQTGVSDIEYVAKSNEMCDLLGLDGISTGVCIGFAMDLYENGLLSKDRTDGYDLRFGNGEAQLAMIDKIARRSGLGDILADGVRIASEKIGGEASKYAVHVKGMEPPAYDVRGIKGMALAFMTSTRGACHLRSCAYALELTGKFWKFENVDRQSTEGKGKEIKELEDLMVLYDTLGVCKFSRGYFLAEGFPPFVKACTGLDLSETELLRIGERISNLKNLFNLREGFKREDSRLPERILTVPIPEGVSKGSLITEEQMEKMLDDYFEARGWDTSGRPTGSTLERLGLES